MSKLKNAMLDRILAVMLALAVLIGVLPIGMAATAQEYPGSYILTVTGEGDTPIEGADIDYTVLVDGIENPDGGSVTTDADGDAPIDLSAYAQELEDGIEIAFDYSISAEGYNGESGSVEVTDLEGNTIVSLEKTELPPVEEVTVSVAVNNSDLGFVTLNGVSAEASNTFVKGEEIELIITPKSNAYISALSIGGTPVTVPVKGDDYSESLTIDADTEISVTFVELVTLSCALLDFASVTFNGEEGLLTVDKGSEVAIAVTPDEGYHITEVKLNGVEQTVTDPTAFTATVTADEDIELTYSLVKVYTFVVEFNENGNVTTDPSITAESGKIETILHENGKIKVTATPNEFYRVSQVVVNGETESFTENGKEYDREFTADKDYTVEITFAENVYKVTASVNGGNGSIGIDSTNTASKDVAYGSKAGIYVTPDAGYTVNEVLIGGVAQTVEFIEDEGLSYFELTVSGDTDISVSFKVAEAASQDDFSFNSSDALRSDAEGKLYVYKKGVKVVFETERTGLRITDTTGRKYGGRYTKTVEINADTVIKSVEAYYSEGLLSFYSWHTVEGITSASPLTIIYDDTKPTVELSPDREPNVNGFYNSSVDYTVNVSDIIGTSKEYTSLSEISYKIESATVTEGVLYSRNTDGDAFTKNALTFIVDSSIHNADDIKVTVTANDIAGNSYTATQTIDINATAPVVNVSIDGTVKGTTAALYNSARTALITVTDRDSSFNSDNVKVTIKAKDAEDNELQSYPVRRGSWAGSNGIHQIEYVFDSADEYGYVSYEWEVTYTNKADMIAAAPTTTGDDVYEFTVDTLNPTGEIGDSSREGWLWNILLEAKDFFFGLFVNKGEGTENQKVEITASALDASGINSILYYKQSDSKTVLTAEELDKIEFFDEAVSVNSDDTFTVYAKITDNAGNVEYISTNGIIYDTEGANLTTEVVTDASSDKQHNKDVKIEYNVVEVSKEGSYSGIKSVDYKIVKTWRGQKWVTEQGNLFTFDKKKPSYNDLVYDLSSVIEDKDRYITISAKDNNSDNVDVIFTVVDNAGNVKEFSLKEPLVINTAEPTVDVKFGGTPVSAVNGKGYFADGRTATITLTDTYFAWDLTNRAPVITVKLNGEDAKAGTDYNLGAWNDGEINEETGMQSHTATLEFITEGSYTWDIEYNNKSDIALKEDNITSVEAETPFNFVIDKTVPEISITVGADDNWTTFIEGIKEALSFGFYNAKTTVKLESSDITSPYKIEYFTTDDFELKSAEEVDAFISSNGREIACVEAEGSDETTFTVDPQNKFIVYARLTDKAGNVSYSSTSGAIVDDKNSSIDFSVLTAPSGQHSGNWGQKTDIYNTDVDVKITVKENEKINSGIKEIKYQIYKDDVLTFPIGDEDGVLYSYEKPENGDSLEDLLNSFEETVTISAEENDSCNVRLVVLVSDNAGNTPSKELTFDIDCTAPVYSVEFNEFDKAEDGTPNNGKYFDIFRQATITVTERADHFNADNATNGISVIATDSNDKVIGDSSIKIPAYNGWYLFNESEKSFIHISNWNSVGDVHTAVVTFHADANYKFGFEYSDDADNAAVYDQNAPEYNGEFVLDAEKPNATVTATAYNKDADGTAKWSWDYLAGTKTVADGGEKFGFNKFANEKIELSITDFHDATIDKNMLSIFYYIVEGDKAVDLLSETDLDSTEIAWKTLASTKEEGEDRVFDAVVIDKDDQFVVYFKVVDPSGNYRYFSTNGLIVDANAPQETIAPVIDIEHEEPVNGIYNEDVIIDFTVNDPIIFEAFSGLNAVKCEITASDLEEGTKQEKDLLLEVETKEECVELTTGKNGLISETKGQITVKSDVFNSNNVTVKITATDNAGNESFVELPLMIDITKPVINVEYDNYEADSENYYKDARKATITITERNFNAEKVEIKLENTDKIIPVVSEWMPSGEGEDSNGDGKTYTATIDYAADGDYTFIINYTDEAENAAESKSDAFTIDRTLPTVSVTYDNNDVLNGNYYKADRTATIVITEHNLEPNGVDKDRINITLNATDDGAAATAPNVSTWKTEGDVHTATISYTADALYSFDIAVKDKAGNDSADFEAQSFYVDKTAPALSISGVADNSANKGAVAPVITYSDTNYDANRVIITLIGANRGTVTLDGSYTDIHNGRTFSFKNFAEEKEIDDIYTLTATLTDKAGNSTSSQISFSVNRFGSTYSFSEETEKLNGSYVQKPIDVVVTETNANALSNIKLTLFKNNETIELKEGTDYRIDTEGGEGQWYKYTYTVLSKNFEDDGVYRITFHSEDEAGNIAENTLDTKDAEVSFGIDKTVPTIVVSNLESGSVYATEKLTVNMSVNDNLKLDSVVVYLDGDTEPYKSWNAEEIARILSEGGDFTFDIAGDSTDSHDVKIVCTDAAGKETVEEITDFFVTTNLWVRYYNNKLLFFGSIAGVLVLIALIIFIILKKKKDDEEK